AGEIISCRTELLDAVVTPVGHVYMACLVHRDAPGEIEFSSAISTFAPGAEKCAVFGVFLNAMVTTVGHQEMLVAIKSEAGRPVKLTVPSALLSPLRQKSALLVEDGGTLQGLVGDIDVLIGIQGNGDGPHKLSIPGAAGTKLAVVLLSHGADRHAFIAHAYVGFRPGPIQHIEYPVTPHSNVDRVVKASAQLGIEANGMAVAVQVLGTHSFLPGGRA